MTEYGEDIDGTRPAKALPEQPSDVIAEAERLLLDRTDLAGVAVDLVVELLNDAGLLVREDETLTPEHRRALLHVGVDWQICFGEMGEMVEARIRTGPDPEVLAEALRRLAGGST